MAEQQWQRLVDSVEGAFSLEVPAGWQGDVRTLRVGQLTRRAVRAVSPDGSVRLSLHDPDLPAFYEPSSGMFVTPGVHQLMPFVPAETFLPQYLQQRFGAAPGFTIGAVVDEPDLVRDTVDPNRWTGTLTIGGNDAGQLRFMAQAEEKFADGATRKEWVMAMVGASAKELDYDVDAAAVSDMVDRLCALSKTVNPPAAA